MAAAPGIAVKPTAVHDLLTDWLRMAWIPDLCVHPTLSALAWHPYAACRMDLRWQVAVSGVLLDFHFAVFKSTFLIL